MKKPMKPTAKRGAKGDDPGYRPRMADPVSGAKLVRGKPIAAANAAPTDYSKMKTVRPVERVKPPSGLFGGPSVDKADIGRVKDPVSGEAMKKGSPVSPAYSGDLNSRVGLGLRAGAGALGAGFKPPDSSPGAKGDAANARAKKKKGRK